MEQNFLYNTLPVRVNTDKNNNIWFAAVDICNVLGLTDARRAVEKLDEDEKRLDGVRVHSGQLRKTWTVNEFGLYSLILTSTKPEAKAFKRWVTHEVLPAIRKAGIYSTEEARDYELATRQAADKLEALEEEKASLRGRIKSVNAEIAATRMHLQQLLRSDYRQLKLQFPKE
jgi:anti-repressor protein